MAQEKTKQNKKRTLLAEVVSNKMLKTVVVKVERVKLHPLYHKRMRLTRKFKAETGGKSYQVGDRVRIEECRPLSRDKRWRVLGKI
jgi:small subunit ribosomal protein S17